MNTTLERKPLPLPGGHDKVLLHSCCGCVYSLRDTNRHRVESRRERIQLGVKFYGDEEPEKD